MLSNPLRPPWLKLIVFLNPSIYTQPQEGEEVAA